MSVRFAHSFVSVRLPALLAGMGSVGAFGGERLAVSLGLPVRARVHAIVGDSLVRVPGSELREHPVLDFLADLLDAVGAPSPGFMVDLNFGFPRGAGLWDRAVDAALAVVVARAFLEPEGVLSDEVVESVLGTELAGAVGVAVSGGVRWLPEGPNWECDSSKLMLFAPSLDFSTAFASMSLERHTFTADEVGQLLARSARVSAALAGAGDPGEEATVYLSLSGELAPSSLEMITWLAAQGVSAFPLALGQSVATLADVPKQVAQQAQAAGWEVDSYEVGQSGAEIVTVAD